MKAGLFIKPLKKQSKAIKLLDNLCFRLQTRDRNNNLSDLIVDESELVNLVQKIVSIGGKYENMAQLAFKKIKLSTKNKIKEKVVFKLNQLANALIKMNDYKRLKAITFDEKLEETSLDVEIKIRACVF